MAKDLLLSYILPCYNTGLYLKQCVESLLDQGFKSDEYEIICVNNASTDNTAEILDTLSSCHSIIKVITLPVNRCSGGAYNAGLDIAQGKYIQFVDSDDYLDEGVGKMLYDLMESKGLDMLYFNIESFCEKDRLTHIDTLRFNGNLKEDIDGVSGEQFVEQYLHYARIDTMPVPAYRKIILRKKLTQNRIRFTHTTIGTDFLHNIELLAKLSKIAGITKRVYFFRYNPNGVTKSRMTSEKIIYALNNYCKAYLIAKCSFLSDFVKDEFCKEMESTINGYLSSIKYLAYSEKKNIYTHLQYEEVLRSVSKGLYNRFYVAYPCVCVKSSLLLTPKFYRFLDKIKK